MRRARQSARPLKARPAPESGAHTHSTPIGQVPQDNGKSKKLADLCEDIKGGLHNKRELADKYGPTYTRIYKGVDHLISLYKKPKTYERFPVPRNTIWFGNTGSGKTWDAEQQAIDSEKSMFKIPMKQLKAGWWDGYQGETIVLYDDFRGAVMEPHEFLNLLDGIKQFPVKGAFVPNESSIIFITSSDHPINWWPKWYAKDDNNWAQVRRRLNNLYYCENRIITEVAQGDDSIYKKEILTYIVGK